jgi:hypothetical protein
VDALDPHQKRFWRFAIISIDPAVWERTMARATIAYLEQRYTVLEKEIADALRDSPTDNRAIADLKYEEDYRQREPT